MSLTAVKFLAYVLKNRIGKNRRSLKSCKKYLSAKVQLVSVCFTLDFDATMFKSESIV